MGKGEKLATKLLSGKSDKNFSFDDLCYVLERAGFDLRSETAFNSRKLSELKYKINIK